MNAEPDRFIPTRRSLLSRVKNWEDHESWSEFERTYGRLIYNAALKAGLSDADAKDVKQNTMAAVSKAMLQFKYDPALGSFKGWLLQTTRWKIQDYVNRVQRKNVASAGERESKSEGTATVEQIADPASLDFTTAWDTEYHRTLYEKALERVKARVRPKTFQLFELLVRKNWPISKIRNSLEVSAAEVHLAKFRVSRQIEKEIRRLEKEVI
jgi:RNA polymerase sigma factor (sigma-70 family)